MLTCRGMGLAKTTKKKTPKTKTKTKKVVVGERDKEDAPAPMWWDKGK